MESGPTIATRQSESEVNNMNSSLRNLIAVAALAACMPALADRRSDDASTEVRNDSMWSEKESKRTTGVAALRAGIGQSGGQIVVDSMNGKGGGAAYLSKWKTDWNDSFSVTFSADLSSALATRASQNAVSGIGFGMDTDTAFALTKGYKTGVVVEMRQALAGKTVQIVARKSGRIVASTERIALADGAHQFEVSWIANPLTQTATVKLFDGASTTPILTLANVERSFVGRSGGIGHSLFGFSTGGLAFRSGFDDFSYSGDDHGSSSGSDGDDDSWCDSDDSDGDGMDDGDDHGGRGSDDSVGGEAFGSALQAAIDANIANGNQVIKAEAEGSVLEVVFKQTATTVRTVLVNFSSGVASIGNERAADDKELEALAVVDSVNSKTASVIDAINAAMVNYPDGTIHSVELEDEDSGPMWSIELVAGGLVIEFTISAN